MCSLFLARSRSLPLLFVALCFVETGCDSDSSQGIPEQERGRKVYALGRLEPREGVVSISGTPGDRLSQFDPDVEENKKAPANGVLGLLASYETRRAQLTALEAKKKLAEEKQEVEEELAEAQLKQAEASLAQAKAQLKQAVLQKPKLDNVKEAARIADSDLQRLKMLKLTDDELVTDHQIRRQANLTDRAIKDHFVAEKSNALAHVVAQSAVEAAEAQRRVAELNKKKLGTKEMPGVFNQAQIIEEEIKIAELALVHSVLWAPRADSSILKRSPQGNGGDRFSKNPCQAGDPPGEYTVLKISLREGEFVSNMPIMHLGKLDAMVCVAEVHEADAKEVRKHQGVTIRSPAFAGVFANGVDPETGERTGGIRGKVLSKGSMISSPGLSSRNPLAPADRSVVEVRIEIDGSIAGAVQHAADRIGGQVTVEFDEKTKADSNHAQP